MPFYAWPRPSAGKPISTPHLPLFFVEIAVPPPSPGICNDP